MEDTIVMIMFEQSTITVLFAALLVVFFIALVAMSIALFVSRGKHEDNYDEDDEKDIKKLEEIATDDKAADIENILSEIEKETNKDIEKENIYDSAMDDIFVNTLAEDYTLDSAFSRDSKTESILNEEDVMDDVFVNTLTDDDEEAVPVETEGCYRCMKIIYGMTANMMRLDRLTS